MIMDDYCIWEKGYHCYSPSVAGSHMLTMLLREMIFDEVLWLKFQLIFLPLTILGGGGSFFLSFFLWLFDEMKWLRWFGWRKKARIYEYISIFSEPLWCRYNPGGNLETRREDVQNDMHEDGAAAPVTVRSGKKKITFSGSDRVTDRLTALIVPPHFVLASARVATSAKRRGRRDRNNLRGNEENVEQLQKHNK